MSTSGTESVATNSGSNVAPAMLVRALRGHITLWSPAMEQRYGFSSAEAVGKVAHELLRTVLLKPQSEIYAELVERKSWSGGLLHRHADGRLIMSAHHWHLHQSADSNEALVSELHADIAVADEHHATILADIISVIGHELRQPLTAIGSYINGANRALQPAWPDNVISSQALTAAIEQLERVKEGMALFRELSETLRRQGDACIPAQRGAAESLREQRVEADDR